MEERMLGRNAACLGGNMQLRGGGSYREKGEQITQRIGEGYRGENTLNREGTQMGPRRDPNTIDIDRGRGGDRTCYVCGKWGHMAKNCWESSNNLYSILRLEKLGNKFSCINTTERVRDVQHTLRPLRKVQIRVGLEKLENYEGVAVRVLLDNRAIGLFMDMTFAQEKRFKMEKLKKPLLVRNVDGMVNAGGAIIYQVECNMFFRGHVKRARMNVCNLGKTEVILGMLQLAAHNLEIDWEKGEVKITCCPPICERKKQEEKEKEVKKVEKDKDEKTLKKLVPKRFWKWKRVFGKKESERIPVQTTWDHAIELKEVCTKKGKDILLVEEEKGESTGICRGSVEERIYLTFQVTPNITSTLCGKKGQHTKNGTGLLTHKPVDNKEWVFLIPHRRYTGWSKKEEGVRKARSEIGIQ